MIPKQNESSIKELWQAAEDQTHQGGSIFPGMTYEEGIIAVLRWLFDSDAKDENPLSE